ncbi:unnamed protein product [Schistosoma mattheei]|uniref:Acyl carrier protein n=1 Tax=Schistosoma mattheei TaxID=31246 RepID=A0AA85AU42_9TREM|nr:unnamed protein product [Schistosoma mattheei]
MRAWRFTSAVCRSGFQRCVLPRNILHALSVSNKIFGNQPLAYPCLAQTRSIKILLSKPEVESKVLAVCSAFDKIQSDKLTLDSSFIKDLGLDSLDHIEVIMEIENEFRKFFKSTKCVVSYANGDLDYCRFSSVLSLYIRRYSDLCSQDRKPTAYVISFPVCSCSDTTASGKKCETCMLRIFCSFLVLILTCYVL